MEVGSLVVLRWFATPGVQDLGERRKLSRLVWVILIPLAILLPGTIIFLVIRRARGSLDKEAFEGLKLIYTIMAIL